MPLTAFSITRSGALSSNFSSGTDFQVADVARVVMVDLVLHLVARDTDLFGVHNNNVITGIYMRCVLRLMLAT